MNVGAAWMALAGSDSRRGWGMLAPPMDVVCQGPWRARSLLWQPKVGLWALTVACHSVFELLPGESRLVTRPVDPPPDGDGDERWFVEPWGPIAPAKAGAEVVVVGHAYAPAGYNVTSLVTRLAVGDFEKIVRVHGQSYFTDDGSLFGPEPFVRMPLRWDRAAGGMYTGNPAGVPTGPDAQPDAMGRVFLPNLRLPGASMARRDQTLEPAGFGPLGPTSPMRLSRLRHHASTWDPAGWWERPLPDHLDVAYFNVAPPDQMLGELGDADPLDLKHLHPQFAQLTTVLRAPTPRAWARIDGLEQQVVMRRDTLVIDADRALAIVVWRGSLPLRQPPRSGVVTLSQAELPGSSARLPPGNVSPKAGAPTNLRAPLPWPSTPPGPPNAIANIAPPISPSPAPPISPSPAPHARRTAGLGETHTGVYKAVPPALPFQSRREPSPLPPVVAPLAEGRSMRPATLTGMHKTVTPALPFQVPQEPAFAIEAPDTGSGQMALGRGLELTRGMRSSQPAPAPELDPLPPAMEAHRPSPLPPSEPPPPLLPPLVPLLPLPPLPLPPLPPPPPPIVIPESERPLAEPPPPPPRPPSEPPPPAPPPPPPRPTVASSLEQCGKVAGRLAQRPADREAILKEEELTPEAWEEQHARWQTEIQADLRRGKKKLLATYDVAYVEGLEEDRGPITAREYGRLAVAAERGEAPERLAELRLPEEAMMRIRRVWLAKIIKDPRAAAEVQAATRAAAEE